MARAAARRKRGAVRRPRWQRRPEARRAELLDAALEVFSEQGFVRAQLEEVARRAGVSKGTVYLYFDSKEALFREMVRAKIGGALSAGEQFVREFAGPSRELLVTFLGRYWQTVREPANARLVRLVLAELGQFPELIRFYLQDVAVRARRVLTAIVERGIARGEFRRVSPVLAARGLQVLCVHLAQFQQFLQPFDADRLTDAQVIDGLVDLALHGLSKEDER